MDPTATLRTRATCSSRPASSKCVHTLMARASVRGLFILQAGYTWAGVRQDRHHRLIVINRRLGINPIPPTVKGRDYSNT